MDSGKQQFRKPEGTDQATVFREAGHTIEVLVLLRGADGASLPSLGAHQLFSVGSSKVILFPGTLAETADGTVGQQEHTCHYASQEDDI